MSKVEQRGEEQKRVGEGENAVKYYPFSVKRRAFEDYLEGIPNDEIAARHGIVKSTLQYWIKTKDWATRKEEIQSKALKQSEMVYEDVIKSNQLAILKRKFRLGALFDQAIREKLVTSDGKIHTMSAVQLKDLADAFSKNSSIDARLAGMLNPQNQLSVIMGSGSMVNIGVVGKPVAALPEKPQEKPIDVEVSEPAYDRPATVVPF